MQTILNSRQNAESADAAFGERAALDSAIKEKLRLEALQRYRILGVTAHPRLDHVVRLIKAAFRVDLATITLLPELGITRLATTGLSKFPKMPDAQTFTGACIDNGAPLAISDLRGDQRFSQHPLVVNEPFARSAAGVPLKSSDGWWLGAVNLWSVEPRTFTADELTMLDGFAQIVTDELDLHRSVLEGAARETLLQAIFDNAAVGIVVNRPDGSRVYANERYCEMIGYSKAEILASNVRDVAHPDDTFEARDLPRKAGRGELASYQLESRLVTKCGDVKWFRFTVSRMTSPGSSEVLLMAVVENIDDKLKAEAARNLLLGEINHRVKNTLAIVQGIARQLLRTTDPADFAEAFETRVQSLARSHDMITQASWEPLPFDQIIRTLMSDTWQPFERQIVFKGPSTRLNPQSTVMIWLLLNELMTNAVKHGALRTPAGTVTITAATREVDNQPWLDLVWREDGENPIGAPARRGLGTYLIDRAPKLGLSGSGKMEFTPHGVNCEIRFPVFSGQDRFQKGIS